ncbi:leucine-rich repeat domain-containing protein [Aduncisulcus paluster]|uniref:Leucine-rich repeat domain-containing protein n=1 Tax=Aduncisulcus paluster TaxID=2918883 RepID=A0ABQ5JWQ1_9EUKA|nr:leucine-rich repeat domain-containing protein [Aduncisulcus paluster]
MESYFSHSLNQSIVAPRYIQLSYVLAILFLFCFSLTNATTVDIPDPNLRQAICSKLELSDCAVIDSSDMLNLTELSASDIDSFEGLYSATNLQKLTINGTNDTTIAVDNSMIDDINPSNLTSLSFKDISLSSNASLSNFTRLNFLNVQYSEIGDCNALLTSLSGIYLQMRTILLESNGLSDISCLNVIGTNMTLLTGLSIGSNSYTAIPSSFGNFSQLVNLYIHNNNISDLSVISSLGSSLKTLYTQLNPLSTSSTGFSFLNDLTGLILLNLAGTGMTDVSDLTSLVALETLYLQNNAISDIDSLIGLIGIKTLFLRGNNISDIGGLANMDSLVYLDMSYNSIDDVSPLATKTSIETLLMTSNELGDDISDISSLTGLKTLSLSDNGITTIPNAFFDDITSLTELYLANNMLDDISNLCSLTSLIKLDLYYNNIDNISSLDGMVLMKNLSLGINAIVDIDAIQNMPDLEYLYLYSNLIDDLSPFSAGSFTNLVRLELGNNRITDVTDLAAITSLEVLTLYLNDVPDISPLKDMVNLTSFTMYLSNVSNIDALTDMSQLVYLNLYGNSIVDISAIANKPYLTSLGLHSNNINDVSPLGSCTSLKSLDIGINSVGSISALAGLTKLINFWMYANQIEDIEVVKYMTGLVNFYADSNSITDVTPLTNLTNLKIVQLGSNQIEDISALSGLSNLVELKLLGNSISLIGSLADKLNLTKLYLSYNSIVDVSPLASCKALVHLYVESNEVVTVDSLSALVDLNTLILANNEIESISTLGTLTELIDLDLGNNQISNITALSSMFNLVNLSLDSNNISDLTGLGSQSSLKYLTISNNNISSISKLTTLSSLTSLHADNNQIEVISPLSDLVSLESLSLFSNQISDIGPLSNLVSLTYLALNSNNIYDISALQYLVKLEELYLNDNYDISTVSYLSYLVALKVLNLNNNSVSDITSLLSMVSLTVLTLSDNDISTLPSTLSSLTNVTDLDLSSNPLDGFSQVFDSLSSLPSLSSLTLNNVNLSDSALYSFRLIPSLSSLILTGNGLTDISLLYPLNSLETLDVEGNKLCNVSNQLISSMFSSDNSVQVNVGVIEDDSSVLFDQDEAYCDLCSSLENGSIIPYAPSNVVCRHIWDSYYRLDCSLFSYKDYSSTSLSCIRFDSESSTLPQCLDSSIENTNIQCSVDEENSSAIAEVCLEGWYGDDCLSECPLFNSVACSGDAYGSCDTSTHECSCYDGYEGDICQYFDYDSIEEFICADLSGLVREYVVLGEGSSIQCVYNEISIDQDVEGLISLDLSSSNLSSIEGVGIFTGLTHLDLHGLTFSSEATSSIDLSELSSLVSLTYLDISETNIDVSSALVNIPDSIITLIMNDVLLQADTPSDLSRFQFLSYITAKNNPNFFVSSVDMLPIGLISLGVENSINFKDCSDSLSTLGSLDSLSANNTGLIDDDTFTLSALSSLSSLEISNNSITDISLLSQLSLFNLTIDGNKLCQVSNDDIASFLDQTTVIVLDVDNNYDDSTVFDQDSTFCGYCSSSIDDISVINNTVCKEVWECEYRAECSIFSYRDYSDDLNTDLSCISLSSGNLNCLSDLRANSHVQCALLSGDISVSSACVEDWYGDECNDECPLFNDSPCGGEYHGICTVDTHECDCSDFNFHGDSCQYVSFTNDDFRNVLCSIFDGHDSPCDDFTEEELSEFVNSQDDCLDLSDFDLTDISDIVYLSSVSCVDLSANSSLTDVSSLSSLTGTLGSLDISGTGVSDISQISALITSLYDISIGNTSISLDETIELFGYSLTGLSVANMGIEDVIWLKDMPDIQYLDLSHNVIQDPTPLFSFGKSLKTLDISYNQIIGLDTESSIENFAAMFPNLEYSSIIADGNLSISECSALSVDISKGIMCTQNYADEWILSCSRTALRDLSTNFEQYLQGISTSSPCVLIDYDIDPELFTYCWDIFLENQTCIMVGSDYSMDTVGTICTAGWYGVDCASECPVDAYGTQCGENTCDSETHMCQCPSDLTGNVCSIQSDVTLKSLGMDNSLIAAICEQHYDDEFDCEDSDVLSSFTVENLAKITYLSIPSSIISIDGLEYAENLSILVFEPTNSYITDLSPIAYLSSLNVLNLDSLENMDLELLSTISDSVVDIKLEFEADSRWSVMNYDYMFNFETKSTSYPLNYCVGLCSLHSLSISGSSAVGQDFPSFMSTLNNIASCSGNCSSPTVEGEKYYPLSSSLMNLDLSSNFIFDPSVVIVQPSLSSVTDLNLVDNMISDIDLIILMFEYSSNLISLDVSQNYLECSDDCASVFGTISGNIVNDGQQSDLTFCGNDSTGCSYESSHEVCGLDVSDSTDIEYPITNDDFTCVCAQGYYENDVGECVEGLNSSSINACDNCGGERGVCVVADSDISCECFSGWFGTDCLSLCPVSSLNSLLCGGSVSGICDVLTHTCSCSTNFYGSACQYYCDRICDVLTHTCSCSTNFYGSACQYYCDSLTRCGSHGRCALDFESDELFCECEDGWYGVSCSLQIPVEILEDDSGNLTNYICGKDYSASEETSYERYADNDSFECDCSSHGLILSEDSKVCIDPASHPTYLTIEGNDTACVSCGIDESSHGQCVFSSDGFTAKCACEYGYGVVSENDASCSVNVCNLSENGSECSNHGLCIGQLSSYSCACDEGWYGDSCGIEKGISLVMIVVICLTGLSFIFAGIGFALFQWERGRKRNDSRRIDPFHRDGTSIKENIDSQSHDTASESGERDVKSPSSSPSVDRIHVIDKENGKDDPSVLPIPIISRKRTGSDGSLRSLPTLDEKKEGEKGEKERDSAHELYVEQEKLERVTITKKKKVKRSHHHSKKKHKKTLKIDSEERKPSIVTEDEHFVEKLGEITLSPLKLVPRKKHDKQKQSKKQRE